MPRCGAVSTEDNITARCYCNWYVLTRTKAMVSLLCLPEKRKVTTEDDIIAGVVSRVLGYIVNLHKSHIYLHMSNESCFAFIIEPFFMNNK